MPRRNIPVPVPPGRRYCHGCSTVKLIAEFGRDQTRADGLRYNCRPCFIERVELARTIRRILRGTVLRLNSPQCVSAAAREASDAEFIAALTPATPVLVLPRKRAPKTYKSAASAYNCPYPTHAAEHAFMEHCGLR